MIILGKKNGIIDILDSNSINTLVKGLKTYTIIGGEFGIVNDSDNIAFKTLLGSCVAIMFYDKVKKIKGMNHFLLPSTSNSVDDMKYGLYSVESMLNEMYKLGCKKENMVCKISGGADIMTLDLGLFDSIGLRNVDFALNFCKTEGFEVISNHTRGTNGRIVLIGINFETFIKHVDNKKVYEDVIVSEKSLHTELSKKDIYDNNIIGNSPIEIF